MKPEQIEIMIKEIYKHIKYIPEDEKEIKFIVGVVLRHINK